jgi:hypothetical protein
MKSQLTFIAGLVALTACAPATTTTTAPIPAGTALAYVAPAAPLSLEYVFADSSSFNIQGGAIGDIKATTRSSGTASATYAANGSDLELRVRITDLAGSFTNSAMGGTTNATEADVTGEAVLTVGPRGTMTVGQLPVSSRAASQIGMGAAFFRRFVIRLPAGQIQRGSSWTDTIATSEDATGMKSSVEDVVTSTWARDTTIAGRTLNVITHAIQRKLDISGSSEGVQIVQKLTGTAVGHSLWDSQRNIVVERFETTNLSGTFDLPAMGLTGLPLTAQGAGRITLR